MRRLIMRYVIEAQSLYNLLQQVRLERVFVVAGNREYGPCNREKRMETIAVIDEINGELDKEQDSAVTDRAVHRFTPVTASGPGSYGNAVQSFCRAWRDSTGIKVEIYNPEDQQVR